MIFATINLTCNTRVWRHPPNVLFHWLITSSVGRLSENIVQSKKSYYPSFYSFITIFNYQLQLETLFFSCFFFLVYSGFCTLIVEASVYRYKSALTGEFLSPGVVIRCFLSRLGFLKNSSQLGKRSDERTLLEFDK